MTSAQSIYWLQWWARPWLWAHSSWRDALREQHLNEVQITWLSTAYPGCLAKAFNVHPCSPALPDSSLIQLLQAVEQRETVLSVVEHVCTARATRMLPDDSLRPWCRSVAKALRPGSWLPQEHVEPLQLLAQWCGDAQWQRLRLLWPRALAASVVITASADHKRLDLLWRAALQRVLESSDVHSPNP